MLASTDVRDASRAVGGVVVLGMHRSGTSAATRVLNLCGLPLATGELVAANDGNLDGHWESLALRELNDELLERLGGNWAGPPPVPRAGDEVVELALDLAGRAAARFEAEHPGRHWLWKDPRLCVTLPFWLAVAGIRPAVVYVHRDPFEVAASLAARDDLTVAASLALWERYVRDAMRNVEGLDVYVTTYDSLLADPAAWATEVVAFLGSRIGDAHLRVDEAAVAAAVRRDLRRARPGAVAVPAVDAAHLAAVSGAVEAAAGSHVGFTPPDLPLPPPWLDRVVEAHAASYRRERALWLEVWRLEGRLRKAEREASTVVNVRQAKLRARRVVDGLTGRGGDAHR